MSKYIPTLIAIAILVVWGITAGVHYANQQHCTKWDNIASKGLCGFNAKEEDK